MKAKNLSAKRALLLNSWQRKTVECICWYR